VRLTSRNVRILEPGEYRDAQVPGLILRVTDTSRAWGLRYTFAGQRDRVSLGPLSAINEKQARELAKILIGGMVKGEDPRVTLNRHTAGALTVPALCEQALGLEDPIRADLKPLKLKPKTAYDWKLLFTKNIEKPLSGIPAAALSRAQIREWGAMIRKRAPFVANRSFEVLRRCYSWAVETELISATPFVKLPMPQESEVKRTRFLSQHELCRLLAALRALPCGYANMVELLLLTGVRRDSVQGARVSDIKGDTWTIPDTKPGRTDRPMSHPVPLSTQARAVIDRQLETIPRNSIYLFPKTVRVKEPVRPHAKVHSRFSNTLREWVGGDRWTLHDFRRTLSTHAEDELGIDIRVISLILGHVPEGVPTATRVYALGQRLADRRLALQAWADWLDSLREKWPTVGPQSLSGQKREHERKPRESRIEAA